MLRLATGSLPRAIAVLAVLAVLVAAAVDAVTTSGRAYAGVTVGDIDVSGMTESEIATAIEQTYAERLAEASATIYASEEARLAGDGDDSSEIAEEQSVEEALADTTSWSVTAAGLEASLPSSELAAQALAVGRTEGGLIARLQAALYGWDVELYAEYGTDALESLANEIDLVIGEPRVDYGVSVEDGLATVTEGHDGYMVDRDDLARSLDEVFFAEASTDRSFVATVEYAALRIDEAAAEATCSLIDEALADGATFTYRGVSWTADAADIGAWVTTSIVASEEQEGEEESGDGAWVLAVSLDEQLAMSYIVESAKAYADEDPLVISFAGSGDDVSVVIESEGTIPQASEAVAQLEALLFGDEEAGVSAAVSDGAPVEVAVGEADAPDSMSFDEAVSLGVITAFASFTTEYTTGSGTEARNHNIQLAADLLDGSVAKAGGGVWSFNETAGECNEEKGFQAAGAIISGEYTDAIGGGICQVATTVFNAVYESGLAITLRYNHTLYISSYPAGRDAAVSWPDLDLQWRNDEESDVMLRMSYTDGTVTATLYGIDPEYQVYSDVGQWQQGEEYDTVYREDSSLSAGTSYVETAGTDGSSITVVRTVYDSSMNLVREDVFSSTYDPKDEVIVYGPGYTPASGASGSSGVG